MKRVYVSGPITKGNRTINFAQACEAQRLLMETGDYAVWNPMLTMLHPDEKNISWETWLAGDLKWIEVADLLIRLPGYSLGAEKECNHARELGIPVFEAADVECLKPLFGDKKSEYVRS